MEEKVVNLIAAILDWWNEHQYDTARTGDGDFDNVFDGEPDFVTQARSLLMERR